MKIKSQKKPKIRHLQNLSTLKNPMCYLFVSRCLHRALVLNKVVALAIINKSVIEINCESDSTMQAISNHIIVK